MQRSPAVEAARKDYLGLMTEARERLVSIRRLTLDPGAIPSPFIREFGALQIRMICEIVGLACLVAHGDLGPRLPKGTAKRTEPGQIFAALEELHSDFFPVPGHLVKTADGWHMDHCRAGPHATKDQVRAIWGRCGDLLHKGNLKRLVGARTPMQTRFADIEDWSMHLENLLTCHRIRTADGRSVWIARVAQTGTVQVEHGVAP